MTNYKLLPEVPTDEMIVSAVNLHMGLPNKAMRLIYEAMYAAAPQVECEDVAEYVKAVRDEFAKIAERLLENVDDWDSSMDKCSARKLTIIEIANEIRALNKDMLRVLIKYSSHYKYGFEACAEQYESAFKAVLEEKTQAKHDEEISNKYYHEAKAKLKVAEDALIELSALNQSTNHHWLKKTALEALNKIRGE